MGLCFEFVEQMDYKWGKIDLFILKDEQWNPSSYVYFACESIAYIALAFVIRHYTKYKHVATSFIIVEAIDLMDFFLTKNGIWFTYQEWPITYNIIKVVIFVFLMLTMAVYELSRDTSTS
jgi:hypothetical protein